MKRILFLVLTVSMAIHTATAQGVKVSNAPGSPDASSLFEIESDAKGFLPPRLTLDQRNSIADPAEGLVIYNKDCKNLNYFDGTDWIHSPATIASPAAITGSSQVSYFQTTTYSVSAVSGATLYEWTVPPGATINSGQGTTSISVTFGSSAGSVCVSASGLCGTSNASCLSISAQWACGAPVTVTHTIGSVAPESKTVNYGTVETNLSGATKCWITQNLGASAQATSAADNSSNAQGWYWQFNRAKGWMAGSVSGWNSTGAGSGAWISANDPCTLSLGTGWRLPTYAEWNTAQVAWTNAVQTYNSVLRLHMTGRLNGTNGSLTGTDTGFYWSSTENGSTSASSLEFSTSGNYSEMNIMSKADGFPVRCIKD